MYVRLQQRRQRAESRTASAVKRMSVVRADDRRLTAGIQGGLEDLHLFRACIARRTRRINSSVLPENICRR